ncbi:heterokaryon incompatibility, partial [Amniculicola lignicola CBS 123094]
FTALSYVWGPPGPSHVFLLGIPFPVTSNCYSALWHLRKKLGAFCIWVDALCIEQANIKEKEQQIPLMGQIYSSAENVYIWLGEGNAATERAM